MNQKLEESTDEEREVAALAPVVPKIPGEAIEFARRVGALCEEFGLRQAEMSFRIDTGYGSKYGNRIRDGESIAERMTLVISRRDGRGRPRTQISVKADIEISVSVVHQPDSHD